MKIEVRLHAMCWEWHLNSAPTPLLRVPKIPWKTQRETSPQGELLGMGIYREFSQRSVPQGLLNTSGSANQADHQLILQGEYLSIFWTMCIPNNDVLDAEDIDPHLAHFTHLPRATQPTCPCLFAQQNEPCSVCQWCFVLFSWGLIFWAFKNTLPPLFPLLFSLEAAQPEVGGWRGNAARKAPKNPLWRWGLYTQLSLVN